MRVYLEVARLSFRRYSTYRVATLAGVFTNTVFGFIMASVLRAALGTRTVAGLDADNATAFAFVAQAMLMTALVFGDFEHVDRVRTGEVAVELLRPIDYAWFRLAADLGRSAFYAVARGIPPFLVGWIVYRFEVPPPWRLLQFFLAVVGAVLVASRFWTAVATLSFWMTDGTGAMQLGVTINILACGGNVPLQFFPDSILQVLRVMPWAATIQRPVEVYLGLSGPVSVLALQLFWFTVLHLLVRFELNAARHRLVINGG